MSLIQRIKRRVCLLAFLLCLSAAAALFPLPTVHASYTVTQTIYSSVSDGQVSNTSTSWSTAYEGITGTVANTSGTLTIGDKKVGSDYTCYRSAVYFDTSVLPDSATVTAAIVSLYVVTDSSDSDFYVALRSGAPTYPHDPLQTSDYLRSNYGSSEGAESTSTSTISGAGYWNLTMTSTGRGWINKTDTTKLLVRSMTDSAPSGNRFIIVDARETGKAYAVKLIVTYTVSEAYCYTFHGPYVDAPVAVYDGSVTLSVFSDYEDNAVYTLTGDGSEEDTLVLASSSKPLLATWNCSSLGNYTRIMYFSEDSEDIYVFVPSDDTPFGLYTFTVFDLQGITGGYLESRIFYDGEYRTVERQLISTINAVPFYMQWAVVYDMRVTCDQGTLNTGTFTALGVYDSSIIIAYGSFPVDTTGMEFTVTAARVNGSWIQINYTDPDSETDWVYMRIQHVISGSYRTDYSTNSTDQTVQVNWMTALVDVNYYVTVIFLRGNDTTTYTYICPAPSDSENPWLFIGEDYSGAIAVGLVIGAGCVFSYATVVGGAWSMVGLAAFFIAIGWLPQTTTSYSIVTFAGLIAALITIAEWKKVEREI